MRKINALAVSFVLITVLFPCHNSSTKVEEPSRPGDSATVALKAQPPLDSANMSARVSAMFVEYSLGDASHYMFKDKDGKTWDFGKDEDTAYKFAVELPKAKSNETNQGWGSNKALQGNWFDITYVYNNEPQYEGGPMGKVAVIKSVKQK